MFELFDYSFEQQVHQLVQLLLDGFNFAGGFLHLALVEDLLGIAGVFGIGDHVLIDIVIDAHILEYLLHLGQNSILAHPHTLGRVFRVPAHQVSEFGGITVAVFAGLGIGGNGLAGGGAGEQPTEDVIFPGIGEGLLMPTQPNRLTGIKQLFGN